VRRTTDAPHLDRHSPRVLAMTLRATARWRAIVETVHPWRSAARTSAVRPLAGRGVRHIYTSLGVKSRRSSASDVLLDEAAGVEHHVRVVMGLNRTTGNAGAEIVPRRTIHNLRLGALDAGDEMNAGAPGEPGDGPPFQNRLTFGMLLVGVALLLFSWGARSGFAARSR
jgi:hypothetical protein